MRARACERVGFLRRGGTAVPRATRARGPCSPEESASRAHPRSHAPAAAHPPRSARALAGSAGTRTLRRGLAPRTCGQRSTRALRAGAGSVCKEGLARRGAAGRGGGLADAAGSDTWVARGSALGGGGPGPVWASQNEEEEPASASGSQAKSGKEALEGCRELGDRRWGTGTTTCDSGPAKELGAEGARRGRGGDRESPVCGECGVRGAARELRGCTEARSGSVPSPP